MSAGLNLFKLGDMYAEHVSSWLFMSCRSYSTRTCYASNIRPT